jgi:hypothetical protein
LQKYIILTFNKTGEKLKIKIKIRVSNPQGTNRVVTPVSTRTGSDIINSNSSNSSNSSNKIFTHIVDNPISYEYFNKKIDDLCNTTVGMRIFLKSIWSRYSIKPYPEREEAGKIIIALKYQIIHCNNIVKNIKEGDTFLKNCDKAISFQKVSDIQELYITKFKKENDMDIKIKSNKTKEGIIAEKVNRIKSAIKHQVDVANNEISIPKKEERKNTKADVTIDDIKNVGKKLKEKVIEKKNEKLKRDFKNLNREAFSMTDFVSICILKQTMSDAEIRNAVKKHYSTECNFISTRRNQLKTDKFVNSYGKFPNLKEIIK